jgi:DNA-binding transcriptional ArsR family regulator
MPITRRRVTSAADMRALSHPVRLDLLDLLATRGPLTATEAAALLDQTPSNMSWHFRKLAEHGFVRQTRGRGRLRPWKIVAESLSFGEDAADPMAASALTDLALDREILRLRRALASVDVEAPVWREATFVQQSRLWLTAAEAIELGEQLQELLTRAAERQADPSLRPPGARLMALMGWIVPDGPEDASAAGAGHVAVADPGDSGVA